MDEGFEGGRPFQLCAPISRANGEDPIGTATPADAFLVVEQRLPWARKVEQSRSFPLGVAEAVARAKSAGRRVRLLAVAPDRAHSRLGQTRLLSFQQLVGACCRFDREEYLVPDEAVGALAAPLLGQSPELGRFASCRQPEAGWRDLLVCTHGTRDACCATLGFPAFVALRRLANQHPAARLRVWRASHLGGHRFAPTLLDLPEGRLWGHLAPDELTALALRGGDVSSLRRRYRGWAALDGPLLQAAERELFVRHGWDWTAHRVGTRLVAGNGPGEAAEVRFDITAPDGTTTAYAATVEAAAPVETLTSSGDGPLEAVPQFRVARLVALPAPDPGERTPAAAPGSPRRVEPAPATQPAPV